MHFLSGSTYQNKNHLPARVNYTKTPPRRTIHGKYAYSSSINPLNPENIFKSRSPSPLEQRPMLKSTQGLSLTENTASYMNLDMRSNSIQPPLYHTDSPLLPKKEDVDALQNSITTKLMEVMENNENRLFSYVEAMSKKTNLEQIEEIKKLDNDQENYRETANRLSQDSKELLDILEDRQFMLSGVSRKQESSELINTFMVSKASEMSINGTKENRRIKHKLNELRNSILTLSSEISQLKIQKEAQDDEWFKERHNLLLDSESVGRDLMKARANDIILKYLKMYRGNAEFDECHRVLSRYIQERDIAQRKFQELNILSDRSLLENEIRKMQLQLKSRQGY